MGEKIKGPYAGEVAAIRRIRAANPKVAAMTLAKGIACREYTDSVYTNSGRTVLSIYSVIRRYDAAVKAGDKPTLVAA